jgi:transposase-like protein
MKDTASKLELSAAESDRAYSVEEAADRIGVCPNTLYNEARAGRLILRKSRRRTVVTATDLAAYLAALPRLPCGRSRAS